MSQTAPMVPGFGSCSSCQPSYLYGLLPQTGVCVFVYVRTCARNSVCMVIFVLLSVIHNCVCDCNLNVFLSAATTGVRGKSAEFGTQFN